MPSQSRSPHAPDCTVEGYRAVECSCGHDERERQAAFIERIRAIARANGYAIGVHGSQARDLDLVAVPWAVEAVGAQDLVDAIKDDLNLIDHHQPGLSSPNPEPKPWGRLGWSLAGCPRSWAYVDLSVAPRAGEAVPVSHWSFWPDAAEASSPSHHSGSPFGV